MPQGKVIAVKPLGFVSQSALMYARSGQAGGSGAGNGNEKEGNLVYIEVYKKDKRIRVPKKVETVVWYNDITCQLEEGDYVKFKINNGKTRPIEGAENVIKLDKSKLRVPGDLLSKVVLLASVVLFFTVVLDKER
ncbi:hypothetical protein I2I11_17515 [Pontibacter sp. 172403-2]|uniref:hypothetical protein n=1 Tax=Pontibacter rufus TaxID=2791028 RepID=UPI0018AF97C6|nr:hypothetical protein [Pontibacter sp. 172403-2]MBF9255101.1 hypothetical protein [Pontibacter sp. 172403-2]